MIDRSSRIKNNLSEQLKIFYDYTKNIQDQVIKPHPLPTPIFHLNIDDPPRRKPSSFTSSTIPPLVSSLKPVQLPTSSSIEKNDSTSITPVRDISKLSLSLNRKVTPKLEEASPVLVRKPPKNITSSLNETLGVRSVDSPLNGSLSLKKSPIKTRKSEPSCPLCNQSYDQISRRPISENSCGHTMCLQCFIFNNNQNGCVQCETVSNENIPTKKKPADDDFDDFDQDQLFDEWRESESMLRNSSKITEQDLINSIYDEETEVEDNADDDRDIDEDEEVTDLYNNDNDEEDDYNNNDDDEDDDDEQNQSNLQIRPYQVQWLADVKNDAAEFSSDHSYPHTKSMLEIFSNVFGLKQFRANQLEAINAALLHHDCFVLMPTGGGKSLCYQLPAVIDRGVTFVISPLRSLIFDQKQKLTSLGILCGGLTSDISQRESEEVYRELYKHTPGLKIVYVTPEKVAKSDQLAQALKNLYDRKLLARFVIDECHCVSEWGHDFRPDYANLGQLRIKYPGINVILLTATATPRVQKDILQQMKININQCKSFIQSFNRSNLIYECTLKGTTDTALKKIANLILTHFADKCGIVYCFSRTECDKTAKYLSAYKIKALSYHAGLTDAKRQLVQNQWANDDCQVICATIAFGMGIDKPNVRFVVHLSMPKSIEGYYQESGRAGRDGEISYCYLFYCYQDLVKMKRLILNDDSQTSTKEAKKIRVDNLNRVYDYCLNNVTCRRTQLLDYFGELFPSSECKRVKRTVCDNCRQVLKTAVVDCTQMSIDIIKLVSEFNHKNVTLLTALDILRGANTKNIRDAGYNNLSGYNSCSQLNKIDLERLVCRLILEGYLKQEIVIRQQQSFESAAAYLKLGSKAHLALSTQSSRTFNTIELTIRTEQSNITNDAKRKQQTPIEQLNEQCIKELKKELKSIFGDSSHAIIIPERAIKEMVKVMPRTKEAMINDVNEITEERYKRYDLHRLLAITQRFGVELDETKRKEAAARRALAMTTTNTTSKRKLTTTDDDEDENINFSTDTDGYTKINKQNHFNRFVKRRKRPAAYFARKNAIAKRKRGGF